MNAPPVVLSLAGMIRDLGPLWVELGRQVQRRDSSQVSGNVQVSKGTETPAPGNVAVISARAGIENFASKAMAELRDSHTWPPRRYPVALPRTLPAVLDVIADNLEYWTQADDESSQVFKVTVADLHSTATKVAYPSERMLPIGVACFEVGCKGQLAIQMPEPPTDKDGRPIEMSDAERKRHFRDTRPEAVCSKNAGHRTDARLSYHHEHAS